MKFRRFITLSCLSVFSVGMIAASLASASKSSVRSFAASAPSTHYDTGDADTYYNSISDSLMGNDLLVALRTLNLAKRRTTISYSSMGTSPSGMFRYTDYDPDYVQYDTNGQPYGTKISSFYTYTSATSWNREHVWPNSHGGGSGGNAGSPYPDQDIHMPRPTISSENSNRGNSFYVEGMCDQSKGWDPKTAGYSELSRGEAARITFYCLTVNSKLALSTTNTAPSSGKDPITGNNYSSGNTMGNLETLLKWTMGYEVTQRERNRNEGAEYLQGNRNAFVDHPEYACRIWGNVNDTTRSLCSGVIEHVDVTGVSLDKESDEVAVNSTITLTATVEPSNASIKTVLWSSVDETIATVTSEGVVKGIKDGTTTITATTKDGGFKATCQVTVKSVAVTGVSLNKTSLSLTTGNTYTLTPTIEPSNASNKKVSWSTNNESVATVSSGGFIRAVGAGTATITATTEDGGFKATCVVTVTDPAEIVHVQSISLNETRKELTIGEKFQLEVTFNPTNATYKDVVWSVESLDLDVEDACVLINSTGLVTAVEEGYALVTVTSVDGMKTAECKFIVKKKGSDPKPQSGCGGNVITNSVILSALAVVGLTIVLIRKVKKEN